MSKIGTYYLKRAFFRKREEMAIAKCNGKEMEYCKKQAEYFDNLIKKQRSQNKQNKLPYKDD